MRTREKQLVQAEEEMENDTFTKHMNSRHRDSLGGLRILWFADEYVHDCWREFHYQLHRFRVDLEHEHSDIQ